MRCSLRTQNTVSISNAVQSIKLLWSRPILGRRQNGSAFRSMSLSIGFSHPVFLLWLFIRPAESGISHTIYNTWLTPLKTHPLWLQDHLKSLFRPLNPNTIPPLTLQTLSQSRPPCVHYSLLLSNHACSCCSGGRIPGLNSTSERRRSPSVDLLGIQNVDIHICTSSKPLYPSLRIRTIMVLVMNEMVAFYSPFTLSLRYIKYVIK